MSDVSWSGRLRIIGDLERPDHWHLKADDECAFFGEYTPREGWRYSSTNQISINLKKRPTVARGTPQWPHKRNAIRKVAAAIRSSLKPTALATRSEEHTSELQSLIRSSYVVFCLKKTTQKHN